MRDFSYKKAEELTNRFVNEFNRSPIRVAKDVTEEYQFNSANHVASTTYGLSIAIGALKPELPIHRAMRRHQVLPGVNASRVFWLGSDE